MDAPKPPQAPDGLHAIAARFMAHWSKMNGLEKLPGDWKPDHALCSADYYYCRNEDLGACLGVGQRAGCVTYFHAGLYDWCPPFYDGTRKITRDERRRWIKDNTKVSIEGALERVQKFLSKVYPNFAERHFDLVENRLDISDTAHYRFSFREAFDAKNPKGFANQIDVELNPHTGVIPAYSAQNDSLPRGFVFGLKAEDAITKANETMKDYFSNKKLRLAPGEPTIWLRYATGGTPAERNRVIWVVGYLFDVLEPLRRLLKGEPPDSLCVFRVFDAATGERMRQEEERRNCP